MNDQQQQTDTDLETVATPVTPSRPATPSPLDASFQRGNGRPHAPAEMDVFNVPDQLQMPSQSLAPENITAHELHELLDGHGVGMAVEALTALRDAVAKTIQIRDAAKADPTMTPSAAALVVAESFDKLATAATLKMDSARNSLVRTVASMEADLRKPITERATGPFAAELRALVRGMSPADRQAFLTDAIASRDTTVIGAVLGAPSALSGLDKTAAEAWTERANRAMNPDQLNRVQLMRHAIAKLEAAGGAHIASMERVTGVRFETVNKLRAQRKKTQTVLNGFVPHSAL